MRPLSLVSALAGLLATSALEARAEDPYESHPEPRVIIDATAAKPDKKVDAIQAAARRGFWGKTVGCYKRSAWAEPKLEVDTNLRIEISRGVVKKAQLRKAKRGERADKRAKRAEEVGACLTKAVVGLAMPDDIVKTASLRVRIAPGDDPIPRPPNAR